MKPIQTAAVLLVDPDAPARDELSAALQALGLRPPLLAASLAAARATIADGGVDACVVAIEAIETHEGGWGFAAAAPPVPSVLIMGAPTRADLRHARLAGYVAVLVRPVAARVLYRRIGSALQRARRRTRMLTALTAASAGRGPAGFET